MAHIKIALVAVALLVLFLYGVGAQAGFTCEDSDGGINYYTKGSVTYTDYVEDIGDVKLPDGTYMDTVDDVCATVDYTVHEEYNESYSGTHIKEYYCNYTRLAADHYLCSSGCKDGACITDSDVNKATIEITSKPSGANVTVVDTNKNSTVFYGKTPITFAIPLAEKTTFLFMFSKRGYLDPESQLVDIVPDSTTTVYVELKKANYGKIKVTSSPSKADVYLDGRYAGITPLSLSEVSVGTHTIEVKLKNYSSYKKVIKVSANRTTPVHAKLTKSSTIKKSAKTTGAATASTSLSKVKCSSKSIIGDADGSKSITPGDSLLITNIALGIEPKPSNICCVDVDNDKDVDSTDARLVFDYYLGMQSSGNNIGKTCSETTVKTGKLKVTSTPSKADAYIRKSGADEWSSIGRTPVTKSLVFPGSYEVSVKKKGYLEARQTVSVLASRTTPLNLKLLKEPKAVCTDSDGGKDYYVKGYTTTDGGTTKVYDSCAWESNKEEIVLVETYTLYEAYCGSKGWIRTVTYKCPQGCENGACIKEPTTCGNGIIDPDEECDGDIVGPTCSDVLNRYAIGTLKCNALCQFDETGCIGIEPPSWYCGNGTIDAGTGETCDGNNLGGKTCMDYDAFTGGTLACTSTCQITTSDCT